MTAPPGPRVDHPAADPGSRRDRAASFEHGAAQYASTRPSYPDAGVDWLLPERARRVLDLAAGTGKLTERLVDRGLEVVAVACLPRRPSVVRAMSPTRSKATARSSVSVGPNVSAPRMVFPQLDVTSAAGATAGRVARWRSMMMRMSGRQEPQFVPACVAAPTAATVVHPRETAAAISLAPMPKQEQIAAPRSGVRPWSG